MTVLAFDTATAACSVALGRADGEVFEHRPESGRMLERPAHATELLPAIVELLDRAGAGWDEIERLAVGVGPGAFTGLRIGVTTARAIATARGLRLTPVSSLSALAAGTGASNPPDGAATVAKGGEQAGTCVLPVIDARRGEYFYRLPGGEDCVSGPDELIDRVAGLEARAVGDGAIKLRDRLVEAGLQVPAGDDPRHVVSAVAIIELSRAAVAGEPASVVPNYIRPPDAKVSSRERWLVNAES
ncbi:MAG: tRNA (adenosine(37)-N6)-threonylcarbamoyltransferase complex dimerization subunit type 1 TsaB [Actinobacteria bacterium]|nr:tRNA (adenosine(37)-N6)-threonylcarbamoyltransferase complex dimerization subunit type 1 TsaB [Actinomycetota bacterium]